MALCSFPESWNGLVMVVSNFIFGSNILQYDNVIDVILNEENHRKTSGGSTSGSALNTKSRGRMTERGNNLRNRGKSRGKSKRRRSQSRGPNDCWYCGKSSGGSTSGSALNAQSRGKMNKRGNNSKNCGKIKRKVKGEEVSIERINDCWYCGKIGHKKRDC